MPALPETIKALQNKGDGLIAVVSLPFALQENVKNLPEDQVLVRIHLSRGIIVVNSL